MKWWRRWKPRAPAPTIEARGVSDSSDYRSMGFVHHFEKFSLDASLSILQMVEIAPGRFPQPVLDSAMALVSWAAAKKRGESFTGLESEER